MHEVFGHTEPTEEMDAALGADAQAFVDRVLTAAHKSIPASAALTMDEVDMGGSALASALSALLYTTQAQALPDITAIAYTLGVAFGGYVFTEGAVDMTEAMLALGEGIHTGMCVRATPGHKPQTFGRA